MLAALRASATGTSGSSEAGSPFGDPDSYPMEPYIRSFDDLQATDPTMEPLTTAHSDFPTIAPGFTPEVHQGITICFISLYTGLFVLAYTQLWLIFYYKHKRLSYQTVFLFLCLIWSGLRITLFSFYFKNVRLANVSAWIKSP